MDCFRFYSSQKKGISNQIEYSDQSISDDEIPDYGSDCMPDDDELANLLDDPDEPGPRSSNRHQSPHMQVKGRHQSPPMQDKSQHQGPHTQDKSQHQGPHTQDKSRHQVKSKGS
ncbi:hypothetical protein Pcinc_007846 [Petrolisthes cinctipes]|uniref:Uncharacterized protein n=1 Tax=Petrolisthes cinctipes TaxID=88211 RepID=A0AAE1GA11_PETCI|nr:hypothetical protein Pcinc_007846 [Petrolisthes cinctipes]